MPMEEAWKRSSEPGCFCPDTTLTPHGTWKGHSILPAGPHLDDADLFSLESGVGEAHGECGSWECGFGGQALEAFSCSNRETRGEGLHTPPGALAVWPCW